MGFFRDSRFTKSIFAQMAMRSNTKKADAPVINDENASGMTDVGEGKDTAFDNGTLTLTDQKLPAIAIGKHNDTPDTDFNADELALGIKTEMEHTDNQEIAKSIAKDHLSELSNYYTLLLKMEGDNKQATELHAEQPIQETASKTAAKFHINPSNVRQLQQDVKKEFGHSLEYKDAIQLYYYLDDKVKDYDNEWIGKTQTWLEMNKNANKTAADYIDYEGIETDIPLDILELMEEDKEDGRSFKQIVNHILDTSGGRKWFAKWRGNEFDLQQELEDIYDIAHNKEASKTVGTDTQVRDLSKGDKVIFNDKTQCEVEYTEENPKGIFTIKYTDGTIEINHGKSTKTVVASKTSATKIPNTTKDCHGKLLRVGDEVLDARSGLATDKDDEEGSPNIFTIEEINGDNVKIDTDETVKGTDLEFYKRHKQAADEKPTKLNDKDNKPKTVNKPDYIPPAPEDVTIAYEDFKIAQKNVADLDVLVKKINADAQAAIVKLQTDTNYPGLKKNVDVMVNKLASIMEKENLAITAIGDKFIALESHTDKENIETNQDKIAKIQAQIQKLNADMIKISQTAEPIAKDVETRILHMFNATKNEKSGAVEVTAAGGFLNDLSDLYTNLRDLFIDTKEVNSLI